MSSITSTSYLPKVRVPPPTTQNSLFVQATKVAFLVVGEVLILCALLPVLIVEAGIRLSFRLSSLFINEQTKPRLIMFIAAEDSFFTGEPISFALNAASRTLKEDYKIEVHYVSTIDEVNQELVNCGNAAAIWFSAHSNGRQIFLNSSRKNGVITKENVSKMNFSKLKSNVPIIIEACNAGKERTGEESIARSIARAARNHRVFAPTKTVNEFSKFIVSRPGKPLRIEWRRSHLAESDSTTLDRIFAVIWTGVLALTPACFHRHSYVTANITACYRYH